MSPTAAAARGVYPQLHAALLHTATDVAPHVQMLLAIQGTIHNYGSCASGKRRWPVLQSSAEHTVQCSDVHVVCSSAESEENHLLSSRIADDARRCGVEALSQH